MSKLLTGRMLHEAYLATLRDRKEWDREWEELRPERKQVYEATAQRLNVLLFPTQLRLFDGEQGQPLDQGKHEKS